MRTDGPISVTSAMASCAHASGARQITVLSSSSKRFYPTQHKAAHHTLTVTLSIRFISLAFSQVVDLSPSCFFDPPVLPLLLAGERPDCNCCPVWCKRSASFICRWPRIWRGKTSCLLPAVVASSGAAAGLVEDDEADPIGLSARRKSINGMIPVVCVQGWIGCGLYVSE